MSARSETLDPAPAPAPKAGVHDMTTGPVRSHVVRMMLFVLVGMTIQTLYGLVDIFWVGRLGKEAVAAVALASNLVFVSLALTQTIGVGCVALVSRAAGKKDDEEVQRLFNRTQSLATVVGVIFLVLGLALRDAYVGALAGDARTAALARTFLTSFVPALALQFTMVGLGSALRGIGDMRPGLVAQTASVLLNMILAPFLVFGWVGGHPLGVAGAAHATLISTLAAVLGLVVYLARGKTFLRVRLAYLAPHPRTWREVVAIGLPAGVEFLLLAIIVGVTYAATRPFGAEVQAGFGIASRITQACFMPAVAIGLSVAAVVGQNLGARAFARVHEARRRSVELVLGFMVVLTLVCQLFAAKLVGIFSSEPAVVAAGVSYLRVVTWGFCASGVVFVGGGIFQGLGNTWPSLAASAFRATVFVVPVLVLGRRGGLALSTIWFVSLGSALAQLVLQQLLLRREIAAKAPLATARSSEG